MQIIEGPEQTDGHDAQGAFKVNWWYVEAVCSDTVSRQGYTADCDPADRSKVYLLPYRNCPDDGASLLKTKLSDEAKAKVVSGYVNIRSYPNTNENAIGQKPNGAMFKVYGYPRCDEQGRIWWSLTQSQSMPGRWVCEVDDEATKWARYLDLVRG